MPPLLRAVTRLMALCTISFFAIVLPANIQVSQAHDGPHVIVQPGDTLSQIAESYGFGLAEILRFNNLDNADAIYVGQELAIPVLAFSTPTASVSAPTLSSSPSTLSAESQPETVAKWQPYIVKAGDSLSVLARDYRIGLARLAEINRLSPAQNLYVGQVLLMPIGSAHATAIASTSDMADTTESIEVATPEPALSIQEHYVEPGEHLGTIAQQYGTTALAIAEANYLPDASLVIPGQRLVIPNEAATDAPTATSSATVEAESAPYAHFPTTTEKWIDVNLTRQIVTAYEGINPVASFLVSTGLPGTPTVQGTFRIWATTPIQDMFGIDRAIDEEHLEDITGLSREEYDYYIDDVEWVQYFHQDYAFHSAYWHNNFGYPMSRGCINMRTDDAKWLFDWASPDASLSSWTFFSGYNQGTLVKVYEEE